MRTTQEIFDRHFARQVERGMTREQAIEYAFEQCYDAVCTEQWTDKSTEALYQDYKAEEHKREEQRKIALDEIERDNWVKTAAIGYHEIGKPFKVRFKNGKSRMMVAEERGEGACTGCAFCRTVGYIDIRPIQGCKFQNGAHAVCTAQFYAKNGTVLPLREDGKHVRYKFIN